MEIKKKINCVKKSRSPSNKVIILVKSGKNRISFSRIIEIFEKRDREFSNLVEKSRPRSRLAEFPNHKAVNRMKIIQISIKCLKLDSGAGYHDH